MLVWIFIYNKDIIKDSIGTCEAEQMTVIKQFEKSNIFIVRKDNDSIQVILKHENCHPDVYIMRPNDLCGNKKYVHSHLVKKLKPFFKVDKDISPYRPDYTSCYRGLSEELLNELIMHLDNYENNIHFP